jgi:hypothetical protein
MENKHVVEAQEWLDAAQAMADEIAPREAINERLEYAHIEAQLAIVQEIKELACTIDRVGQELRRALS